MAASASHPALTAPARARARLLPRAAGGLPRLVLQDGPIDLVIMADGEAAAVEAAYGAARARFESVLDELCAELPLLRRDVREGHTTSGVIARRMQEAVRPLSAWGFLTPMAAVAGAVAEAILAAMTEAAPLDRAAVNNGGDIALYLAPGTSITLGMVARPELGRPDLFGRVTLAADGPVRGVATSGRHGRSFSLGIADAVTVLAHSAAAADAAATVIANAVDLPGHPAVARVPAAQLQSDSDLGDLPVVRDVGFLRPGEIAAALAAGLARAEALRDKGLIVSAALHLAGETRVTEDRHG